MSWLEGANCVGLHDFVIEKYFHCNVQRSPELAQAAKAICSNCVVMTECREAALNMPDLQRGGVIGGVSAAEIRRARRWRNYELGYSKEPPYDSKRPEWLSMPEAAERIEQLRQELDPDEQRLDPYRETNPFPREERERKQPPPEW